MKSIMARLWSEVVDASTSTLSKPDSQPVEAGVASRTPDLSASLTPYAGFWRRLGALLIDCLVFLPISATVTWASTQSRLAALLLLFPGALLGCAYQVYFHARWGQTPGKMVARVRVLSLDGSRIGLRQAFLRSAVDIFLTGLFIAAQASALLQIPPAEYASLTWLEQSRRIGELQGPWRWLLWVEGAWTISEVVTLLFNRRRRALHDLIAGTVVLRTGAVSARFTGATAMADSATLRSSVRAHLGAGCLVVAAIAGLMSAWHFPVVIGSFLKSNREAVFSAAFDLAFSLAFALAVWILFYLPSSLVADMITKDRSARLWLAAFFCMIGVGATSLAISARHGRPSITPTNIVVSVEYSVVLGLGCGLYSFLKSSFSPRGK